VTDVWDRRFVALARAVSEWSKDPSTRTGAVVVDGHRRILSLGYNGFPVGVRDDERLTDREAKYRLIVHADLNAIYTAARLGLSLVGATMYLTGHPCNECMKGIIQVGIRRVAWPADNPFENDPATRERWADALLATHQMASESGVNMDRINEEETVTVPNPEKALELIERYGGIDGEHHKQWVIDQVVRALTGDGYAEWVREMKDGEDGPDTYEWDEGIAP
jgi:dCMP deaminase